ncbi:YagK/YfjJ domain-containing protein [Modicisalibacter coralii]|uniref:YagK/YfjJ domain-containing protein n=1 Tax=Modicisalibacter coralii TaxID=2304602 RepID=UPI00100B08FD|nr:inovirus-type Gp2 protein [Halomonas coralii]
MKPAPSRLAENTNLNLIYDPIYQPEPGVVLPIQTSKGPLVEDYLYRLYRVICQAIEDHKRVLACRFDLTLPHGVPLPEDAATNGPINRFHKSLNAKIAHDRKMKQAQGIPHGCRVRYARAREISQDGMPHYHVLLLLNLHAYYTPGNWNYEGKNLFWRVAEAWASALQVSLEDAVGQVRLCRSSNTSCYYLEPANGYQALPALFEWSSYLCKAHSKQYGGHVHAFETSRR